MVRKPGIHEMYLTLLCLQFIPSYHLLYQKCYPFWKTELVYGTSLTDPRDLTMLYVEPDSLACTSRDGLACCTCNVKQKMPVGPNLARGR